MKWNLPNRLTLLRILCIPVFLFFVIVPVIETDWIWRLIATVLFALISSTDFLDGHIARKYNLVTDLGKFLDPLADKMLIFGALLGITLRAGLDAGTSEQARWFAILFCAVAFLIIFREMAVTSLRLVVSRKEGVVVAAAWAGKMKTVSQMVGTCVILMEPAVCGWLQCSCLFIASYISLAVMLFLTIYSGVCYFMAYREAFQEDIPVSEEREPV